MRKLFDEAVFVDVSEVISSVLAAALVSTAAQSSRQPYVDRLRALRARATDDWMC